MSEFEHQLNPAEGSRPLREGGSEGTPSREDTFRNHVEIYVRNVEPDSDDKEVAEVMELIMSTDYIREFFELMEKTDEEFRPKHPNIPPWYEWPAKFRWRS